MHIKQCLTLDGTTRLCRFYCGEVVKMSSPNRDQLASLFRLNGKNAARVLILLRSIFIRLGADDGQPIRVEHGHGSVD